jgi:hypothetical protein
MVGSRQLLQSSFLLRQAIELPIFSMATLAHGEPVAFDIKMLETNIQVLFVVDGELHARNFGRLVFHLSVTNPRLFGANWSIFDEQSSRRSGCSDRTLPDARSLSRNDVHLEQTSGKVGAHITDINRPFVQDGIGKCGIDVFPDDAAVCAVHGIQKRCCGSNLLSRPYAYTVRPSLLKNASS